MSSDARTGGGTSLWPIATMVVWMVCLAVSAVGLTVAYPVPPPAVESVPPTQIVDAALAPQPLPRPAPAPPPAAPQIRPTSAEPPAASPLALPERPAVVAVAPPSAAIAFAMPTEGLTRVVDASQAGYTGGGGSGSERGSGAGSGVGGPAAPPPAAVAVALAPPPAVARLTLGEGEGQKIQPEYPREAVLAEQEGTVGLRFTVGTDGRVESVEVTTPCRWPALNQAAVRAVRAALFTPGARRIYEVPIQFQLNR